MCEMEDNQEAELKKERRPAESEPAESSVQPRTAEEMLTELFHQAAKLPENEFRGWLCYAYGSLQIHGNDINVKVLSEYLKKAQEQAAGEIL